uniref:Ig-like domain-containing protein n=1 Tax=Astyanax mexicanus TaxID=7994 RepID=A0A3B1IW56_ASTMX
ECAVIGQENRPKSLKSGEILMLKNQEALEGEDALLCCEISKPGAPVQWKKGTLELKIHDLKSQDTGSYKCYAGSAVTTASSLMLRFLILCKFYGCPRVKLHCSTSPCQMNPTQIGL